MVSLILPATLNLVQHGHILCVGGKAQVGQELVHDLLVEVGLHLERA